MMPDITPPTPILGRLLCSLTKSSSSFFRNFPSHACFIFVNFCFVSCPPRCGIPWLRQQRPVSTSSLRCSQGQAERHSWQVSDLLQKYIYNIPRPLFHSHFSHFNGSIQCESKRRPRFNPKFAQKWKKKIMKLLQWIITYLFPFIRYIGRSYWVRDCCSAIIFVKPVKSVFIQVLSFFTQCSADAWIVALLWKLPQMPSCSANNANLDKNSFDNYKIYCCAAILGWVIMLLCTEINSVISFFVLRNLESNPGFFFLTHTVYWELAELHNLIKLALKWNYPLPLGLSENAYLKNRCDRGVRNRTIILVFNNSSCWHSINTKIHIWEFLGQC